MKNEVYLRTDVNGKAHINVIGSRDMSRHIYDFLGRDATLDINGDLEMIRARGVNLVGILKSFVSYLENDADNPKMASSDEDFAEFDESDDCNWQERCQILDIR